MPQKILVTGGAGFIGSHFVKLLMRSGYEPVVIDNLKNGNRDAVLCGDFHAGELTDERLLRRVFKKHSFKAVVHFAAYMYVAESIENPRKYYEDNTAGALSLLRACHNFRVDRFLFSSSCSVYGAPKVQPISEDSPTVPINPYGWTKFYVEKVLESYRKAEGLRAVALRYFNVAGADPENELGERHRMEIHAIPLMLQAARNGGVFRVFGNDFPTKDGTCIRDYIHVWDLARAHLKALRYLDKKADPWIFNLGTGRGSTVLELAGAVEKVTGKRVRLKIAPRREGDPPELVADPSLANRKLGWRAEYTEISQIVDSSWRHMLKGEAELARR